MDPHNRNKVKSNISQEETEALKQLVKLQRERQIVIKPCDKGAGIIILDFEEYRRAALEHLNAKTITGDNYYKKVDESVLKEAKVKITDIVKEAYDNDIISHEEYSAMVPKVDETPVPGRFYCTFKVHKKYELGKAPPPRGIVSCSGTMMENIAIYVEHHIKNAGKSYSSYLEDTPDFLRQIEHLNNSETIPENAMLVVLDVIGLYDNIPPEEGVQSVGERLKKTGSLKVPIEFIMRLLQIIQDYSIFEFDGQKYQQEFGTSMGSKPAPSYANSFMAENIDPKILQILEKYTENGIIPLKFMKRFLDDIFLLFCGTVEKLHQFFEEINNIHKDIKFTMSHTSPSQPQSQTCSCPPMDSIPYLDTSCKIRNGRIITDLYRKPTDKNQYLLTSSCHPH